MKTAHMHTHAKQRRMRKRPRKAPGRLIGYSWDAPGKLLYGGSPHNTWR